MQVKWLALATIASFTSITKASEPAETRFAHVLTHVQGATIDWTSMRLSIEDQAQPTPGSHTQAQVVEQQARGKLGPRVLEAAGQVRLDADARVRDLIEAQTRLGEHLGQESSSWHVAEARYYTSGRVEITGQLDLGAWLRPVAYARASDDEPPQGENSRFTGVVVDARGLDAQGALAPRVLSSTGQVLYAIEHVHKAVSRKRMPVQYVTDPADPLAYERAGDNPLLLRAVQVESEVDLVLSPEDSVRLQTVSRDVHLLTDALVVLVLDP